MGIIGEDGASEENDRAPDDDGERRPVELLIERKADQLDRVGERVEQADLVEDDARFLDAPQRVERGGGEEHREDHEVHHAGEVLELADQRGQEQADARRASGPERISAGSTVR